GRRPRAAGDPADPADHPGPSLRRRDRSAPGSHHAIDGTSDSRPAPDPGPVRRRARARRALARHPRARAPLRVVPVSQAPLAGVLRAIAPESASGASLPLEAASSEPSAPEKIAPLGYAYTRRE